ncbi:MAG: PHP domain-containing protein [Bacillota bacterium]
MLADLHIHTRASDGTLSPAEVVRTAASRGLQAIAIADHDTIAGIEEAMAESLRRNVLVIPAVEISTTMEDEDVHILGYYVPTGPSPLEQFLQRMRAERQVRMRRMIERLRSLGIFVSEHALIRHLADGSLGRPHLARVLVAHGVVASEKEAFDRYLKEGRPAYVPRAKVTPLQAVKVLRASGAVPVLAHPSTGSARLLSWLSANGLLGVEVNHPELTSSESARYLSEARCLNLVATGGSDCHDDATPGRRIGEVLAPRDAVTKLEAFHMHVRSHIGGDSAI